MPIFFSLMLYDSKKSAGKIEAIIIYIMIFVNFTIFFLNFKILSYHIIPNIVLYFDWFVFLIKQWHWQRFSPERGISSFKFILIPEIKDISLAVWDSNVQNIGFCIEQWMKFYTGCWYNYRFRLRRSNFGLINLYAFQRLLANRACQEIFKIKWLIAVNAQGFIYFLQRERREVFLVLGVGC